MHWLGGTVRALVLLLSAAFLCSILVRADGAAPVRTAAEAEHASSYLQRDFYIVSSPQEAYERALFLLRSTVAAPAGTYKEANKRRGSHTNDGGRDSLNHSDDFFQVYWDYIISWSPFGTFHRAYKRLGDLARSYTPLRKLLGDSSSSTAKLTATLRKRKAVWEGSNLVTASQSFASGNDPVEEEQARRFPSARRKQLWPEWDGGDDVFFGPFSSTTVDESQLRVTGWKRVEETFKSIVASKVRAVKQKASFTTRATFRRSQSAERKVAADKRRAEAVALLTWAAGWGDAEAIQDEEQLLAMPTGIDWAREAVNGPIIGATSSETYITNFLLASAKGTQLHSNLSRPHPDALWVLGTHSLWGTHGTTPRPARAKACFERLAGLNGNSSAHAKLGWLEGGAWGAEGWALMGVDNPELDYGSEDRQAKALIHYTAAAKQGDTSAQQVLAYRYHAGIGVAQNCGAALYWYEMAAAEAHKRFISGPPGGLTLPYTHLRLSDISGGVYGPGSSAASTGQAKNRPAIQAALHSLPSDGSSDGRRLEDLLEFFTYHADRGSPSFALRLARVYYGGSVLGASESAARVQRDYRKAREYLLKITQEVWPTDSAVVQRGGPTDHVAKKGQRGEDIKMQTDDSTAVQAGFAAGLIGKMWLRGEGVRVTYPRAWVWFSRGAEQGDAESLNGIGVMYRDGLGIPKDHKKATEYFEAAAQAHSSEGCINLAKIHLDMRDVANAAKWFDWALKLGDHFEAYFYLAKINVLLARYQKDPITEGYVVGPPGTSTFERCRNAVNGYKTAAERGDWEDGTFSRAERAWSKGYYAKALLGWTMAGEKGFEAAQNNVAWVLDRDKKRLRFDHLDVVESNATDRLALIHWIRSAAQDNVDALVKMGDYYYHGLGLGEQTSGDRWHASPTTTSARLPPSATASYDKAAACYASAAERQTSALAFWNLGFLYEKGLGVPKKDYNLAKRYYDMALDLNPQEAYLPVFLSLTKLVFMAVWDAFAHKDASALSLLNSLAFGGKLQGNLLGSNPEGPYTEAEEERLRKEAQELELEENAVKDFYRDHNQDDLADLNLPETYETGIGGSKRGNSDGDHRAIEEEDLDDTIEGLMIVIGVAALAWLVYARQGVQLRLDRMRRENQNAAEGAAGAGAPPAGQGDGVEPPRQQQQQQHQGPPEVDPHQPFGWPLQDGNAYAGL